MAEFTTVHDAFWKWVRDPLAASLSVTLPSLLIVVLLPASLLGLADRRNIVFLSSGACMIIGMGFFYIFLTHYTANVASSVIFAAVLAMSVLHRAWPTNPAAAVFVPLALLGLSVRNIAIDQQNFYEPMPGLISRANYYIIPNKVQRPALVFFRFDKSENPWEEPVYNWDVVNPDDAPIIRAHDLGPARDIELLRYYKTRKPQLHVYTFDRVTRTLRPMGTLDEAIEKMTEMAEKR